MKRFTFDVTMKGTEKNFSVQGAHEKGTEKNFSMNNTEYPTEKWKSI